VAIIAGRAYYWIFHSSGIIIRSVDSISTGYQTTVAVSTGKHTVIAHYMGTGESSISTFGQFKLVFDVEAGHRYKIKLKSRWRKPSLLVVDTESGMVVGSSD
jgi:hypothetical protein